MEADEGVVEARAEVRSYLRAQLVALAASMVLLPTEILVTQMGSYLSWEFLGAIFTPAYLVMTILVFACRSRLARAVASSPSTIVLVTWGLAVVGTLVAAIAAAVVLRSTMAIPVGCVLGGLYCLLPMIASGLIGMQLYLWSNEAARKR